MRSSAGDRDTVARVKDVVHTKWKPRYVQDWFAVCCYRQHFRVPSHHHQAYGELGKSVRRVEGVRASVSVLTVNSTCPPAYEMTTAISGRVEHFQRDAVSRWGVSLRTGLAPEKHPMTTFICSNAPASRADHCCPTPHAGTSSKWHGFSVPTNRLSSAGICSLESAVRRTSANVLRFLLFSIAEDFEITTTYAAHGRLVIDPYKSASIRSCR